jgi:hypothetical protein
MKMLRVISKKDGFRRAGRAWSGTTEVPLIEFTNGQIIALTDESDRGGQLVVLEFESETGEAAASGDGAKTRRPSGK